MHLSNIFSSVIAIKKAPNENIAHYSWHIYSLMYTCQKRIFNRWRWRFAPPSPL